MSLRAIRERARRALHERMSEPATYYEAGGSAPRLVHVRVHTKWIEQGDLQGTTLNGAEQEETTPKVIFDRAEVPLPTRNSIVVLTASQGYRIGHTEPADGFTITANVTVLSPAALTGLTLPENL